MLKLFPFIPHTNKNITSTVLRTHYICTFLQVSDNAQQPSQQTACGDRSQFSSNNVDLHAQYTPSRAVFEEIAAW